LPIAKVEDMVKHILIAGMGNRFSGDDGVGPHIICRLEALYRFADGVELADLGTPGMDLAFELSGYDAAILVDAVSDGKSAGSVSRYRKEEILRNGAELMRLDTHSLALAESLLIADLAAQAPKDLLLIGVTGERFDFSPGLSEPVRNAVNQATCLVLAELDRLGVRYWKKDLPAPPRTWWEPPIK